METLTYNLRNNSNNSDIYYKEIEKTTDIATEKADFFFGSTVESFICHLGKNNTESIRTREEYLYELMSLSIYFGIYAERAGCLRKPVLHLLASLVTLRRKNRKYKPYIDLVRGILSTIFLEENKHHSSVTPMPALNNLTSMILFLEATGEFREEVKRFNNWVTFLKSTDSVNIDQLMRNLLRFSDWFNNFAKENLSRYTANVSEFHSKSLNEHRWKEDYIFCSRKEVEYHLGMVGAEIMNRAFKSDFAKTTRKAVLAPACMRNKSADECKARRNSLDLTCTGCSQNCRINELTRLGKENGFDVHIIPHSSDFTNWLEKWGKGKNIGVIGVACILNLITGGYELKGLDIAAQCVLLDFCGCKSHWDKEGFPTELNTGKLLDAVHGSGCCNKDEQLLQRAKWS